jgi:hypothetical protein
MGSHYPIEGFHVHGQKGETERKDGHQRENMA